MIPRKATEKAGIGDRALYRGPTSDWYSGIVIAVDGRGSYIDVRPTDARISDDIVRLGSYLDQVFLVTKEILTGQLSDAEIITLLESTALLYNERVCVDQIMRGMNRIRKNFKL